MAVWSVPLVDPWLDLLLTSLSDDHRNLPYQADRVLAPWWRLPPWSHPADAVSTDVDSAAADTTDFTQRVTAENDRSQHILWRAAITIFRKLSGRTDKGPLELSGLIAHVAELRMASTTSRTIAGSSPNPIADWLEDTRDLLHAKTTLQPHHWRNSPVGVAIQLVLARSEPDRFAAWPQDLPDLPPAVWWSAGSLFGLMRGFKRLDVSFRGGESLQEALSVRALRTTGLKQRNLKWPSVSGRPRCRPDWPGVAFLWGDRLVEQRPWNTRSRWYYADLDHYSVRRKAIEVAGAQGWVDCVSGNPASAEESADWTIGDKELFFEGPGYQPTELERTVLDGEDTLESDIIEKGSRMFSRLANLLSGTSVDGFHEERFRRQVAVTGNRLPEPPVIRSPAIPDAYSLVTPRGVIKYDPEDDAEFDEAPNGPEEDPVPGLSGELDFLSVDEEARIVDWIDRQEWSAVSGRRIQRYGWRYDCGAGQFDRTSRPVALPVRLRNIAQRLVDKELMPWLPDQVTVNEYVTNQGIARHVDDVSSFDGYVAMVSLLESWEMVFRKMARRKIPGGERYHVMLDRRCAISLRGPARYDWTHAIPKRRYDPDPNPSSGERPRIPRIRRLSLTFRKVREATGEAGE